MDFSINVLLLLLLTICSIRGEEIINKLLIVSGETTKTELWPKPGPQCALPDFPLQISSAVGIWTAQGPMVCGGSGGGIGNKCFLYKEHQWMPWNNMGTARRYASSLQIDQNRALIIGGYGNWNDMKSTEVISSSGSEEGKDFPVTISYHCSFTINSTHGLVTGGNPDGSNSASTWFVDLAKTTFTPGPAMKSIRGFHGCATFHLGSKSFGIVAGGGERDSTATEIIDLDKESPIWTEGPKLPRGLSGLTLAKTSQGTYAIGGWDEEANPRAEVLQLDCPGNQIQSCQWQEMPEKLEAPRINPVIFPLVESYEICN